MVQQLLEAKLSNSDKEKIFIEGVFNKQNLKVGPSKNLGNYYVNDERRFCWYVFFNADLAYKAILSETKQGIFFKDVMYMDVPTDGTLIDVIEYCRDITEKDVFLFTLKLDYATRLIRIHKDAIDEKWRYKLYQNVDVKISFSESPYAYLFKLHEDNPETISGCFKVNEIQIRNGGNVIYSGTIGGKYKASLPSWLLEIKNIELVMGGMLNVTEAKYNQKFKKYDINRFILPLDNYEVWLSPDTEKTDSDRDFLATIWLIDSKRNRIARVTQETQLPQRFALNIPEQEGRVLVRDLKIRITKKKYASVIYPRDDIRSVVQKVKTTSYMRNEYTFRSIQLERESSPLIIQLPEQRALQRGIYNIVDGANFDVGLTLINKEYPEWDVTRLLKSIDFNEESQVYRTHLTYVKPDFYNYTVDGLEKQGKNFVFQIAKTGIQLLFSSQTMHEAGIYDVLPGANLEARISLAPRAGSDEKKPWPRKWQLNSWSSGKALSFSSGDIVDITSIIDWTAWSEDRVDSYQKKTLGLKHFYSKGAAFETVLDDAHPVSLRVNISKPQLDKANIFSIKQEQRATCRLTYSRCTDTGFISEVNASDLTIPDSNKRRSAAKEIVKLVVTGSENVKDGDDTYEQYTMTSQSVNFKEPISDYIFKDRKGLLKDRSWKGYIFCASVERFSTKFSIVKSILRVKKANDNE